MLALSGTVDRLHLGDLLEWLHLTRASGRLLLTAGSTTRAFDFVNGKVAFVASSRACERMASWLLRQGIVDRGLVLRALAISQIQGEPFTVVVERVAGVSRERLAEVGRSLATALASRVLREDKVSFVFDQTWPVADRLHVDLGMESSNLLMQAAFRVDTLPPGDAIADAPAATLGAETIERLFWSLAEDLAGEVVDAAAFAASHAAMVNVGALLNRWVTQGSPLLPLGPVDRERVNARVEAGERVLLEDSPTFTWDLLSLVNSLDAPGFCRATSGEEAWLMAGPHAFDLARMVLGNSRWRREWRGDSDEGLRRASLARAAAGRTLARTFGVEPDTAATAAVLPVVLLEFVATALSASPMASPAMQRAALQRLLPLVGHAAGLAAGLPEVLLTALTGRPADHPGARLAALAALAAGDVAMNVEALEAMEESPDISLVGIISAAREAAQRAVDSVAK